MSYFQTFKINQSLYQIKDAMGVLTTLIIGTNKALLIDTGYGIGDLSQHIKGITDKPLIVVNSHGHMDHTGGNYQFKTVFIKAEDYLLCQKHNSLNWRKNNLETAISLGLISKEFNQENYLAQNEGNLQILKENHFDLGNINIEIINMEGHTKGSIGFLIEEQKILVVTDATCPWVWLFLKESTTVSTYIKMLERILKLDFNYILLGHGKAELTKRKRVYEFLEVAKNINIEESEKVTFKHFENENSYAYTKGTKYNQDDSGIIFNPEKL